MIKYFIEDFETKEWYKQICFSECIIKTNEHKPEPVMWTKDPHEAMAFDTRKEAIEFLSLGLTYKNNGWDFMVLKIYAFTKNMDSANRRDLPKNLVITEHEFI